MNRRQFLLGSAAALVAAPAVAATTYDVWENATKGYVPPGPNEWYLIGYDTGPTHAMVVRYRVHDQMFYIDSIEEDLVANEIRHRWRANYPEIAKWWGAHGS